MAALSGLRLAVAGGGALGLGIAALAGRAGARVTVFEPRPLGDNASGVAAGMLSPAFEAVLDGSGAADLALFREGYAAWPAFAARVAIPAPNLAAAALYLGPAADLARLVGRFADLGVEVERLTPAAARRLQPALPEKTEEVLCVRPDGRLDPLRTLGALAQRIAEDGGEVIGAACPGPPAPGFDATVLAAGFETRRWADQAPELAALEPIKGHVLHYRGGPTSGPVVRSIDGYAAPQRDGTVFGATMEFGRADLDLDPAVVARLHGAASALLPALAHTPFVARTGVRASTPDGRPLAGCSHSGLHLAAGARRNGWLLAPLIAAAVVEGLQGGDARSEFDPRRFGETVRPLWR